MKSKIDNNLRNAKNIGATIEKYLNEIGIFTLADLAETTSVKAFIKIREQHPEKTIPVCYYLYSLEGALLNLHWNDIPSELKKELKESLYRGLAPLGIRVTTLCPGWVNTDMAKKAGTPFKDEEMIQPDDLLNTIRCLLNLSENVCIKDIVFEMKKSII